MIIWISFLMSPMVIFWSRSIEVMRQRTMLPPSEVGSGSAAEAKFSSNRGRCRQRRSETIVTLGSVMMGNLNHIVSEVAVREGKEVEHDTINCSCLQHTFDPWKFQKGKCFITHKAGSVGTSKWIWCLHPWFTNHNPFLSFHYITHKAWWQTMLAPFF